MRSSQRRKFIVGSVAALCLSGCGTPSISTGTDGDLSWVRVSGESGVLGAAANGRLALVAAVEGRNPSGRTVTLMRYQDGSWETLEPPAHLDQAETDSVAFLATSESIIAVHSSGAVATTDDGEIWEQGRSLEDSGFVVASDASASAIAVADSVAVHVDRGEGWETVSLDGLVSGGIEEISMAGRSVLVQADGGWALIDGDRADSFEFPESDVDCSPGNTYFELHPASIDEHVVEVRCGLQRFDARFWVARSPDAVDWTFEDFESNSTRGPNNPDAGLDFVSPVVIDGEVRDLEPIGNRVEDTTLDVLFGPDGPIVVVKEPNTGVFCC